MAINPRQLGSEERVILHLRTHGKKLWLPALVFIVSSVGLGWFLAIQPTSWRPIGTWIMVGLYLVVVLCWVLVPILKWSASTYTVTNRRIITRKGIINRTGHDLPLRRVSNVSYERDLFDRLLGCGTLVLETAAEQPLVLPDVPRVEDVHVQITEVLFGDLDSEPDVHDD